MTQAQKNYVIKEINEKVIDFKNNRPQESYESVRVKELFLKLLNSGKIKIGTVTDLKEKIIHKYNGGSDYIKFIDLLNDISKRTFEEARIKMENDIKFKRNKFERLYDELKVNASKLIRNIMLESSEEALKALADFDKTLESYKKQVTAL